MPTYVFAYHGGKIPETEQAKAAVMARWRDWIEGLGEQLVDKGNPVGKSKTVSRAGVTDDGGANPLSGFSVVAAADIDAAVRIAQTCPHLDSDGTIEIAPSISMQPEPVEG